MMSHMAGEGNGIIGFLADYANGRFSAAYAAAARTLLQTGGGAGIESAENLMLFAVYDYHICVCLIRADGSWESGLFMSDLNVLSAFDEDWLKQAFAEFYVTDAEIEIIR